MDSFLKTYGTHKEKQEWQVLFTVSCIVCIVFHSCPSTMLSSNIAYVFTQSCLLRVKYMWQSIYHHNDFEVYSSPGIKVLWTSSQCISRTLFFLTTETAYPLVHDFLPSTPTNQWLWFILSIQFLLWVLHISTLYSILCCFYFLTGLFHLSRSLGFICVVACIRISF